MPKVSVIVPNYNHARFLDQRIQSILSQTYQDFELIYLDDASTDNSNEIIAKYADNPRLQIIANQTNSGSPFKQWNKGISLAKGEYIWIAESDDYADLTLLKRLVEKLDTYPSVGVAYCQSFQTDEYGNINSTLHFHTNELDLQRWKVDFIESGHVECSSFLICKNTIPNASGVLFRKSLYEQVGGADTTKVLCGDWLLWTKMLLVSDVAFVAEPLNYFRKHTSTSRARLTKLGYELTESLDVLVLITQNIPVSNEFLMKAINLAWRRWEETLFSETSLTFDKNFDVFRKIIKIKTNWLAKVNIYLQLARRLLQVIRFRLKLGTRLKAVLGTTH